MSLRAPIGTLAAMLVLAAPAVAHPVGAGSPGLDDPFFPLAGNGGYDVKHYSLKLDYTRATNRLDGRAVISARATQGLSRFNLDLRGFRINTLRVDGRDARFTRAGQELTVIPRDPLHAGRSFTVTVGYGGQPEVVVDPDEALEGWVTTEDGAFVVGEPQGSPGWFPANDNPRDKATYDFEINVPAGITALANGRLLSKATRHGRTTWRWAEDSPMASYLATATNGVFELRVSRTRDGLPIYDAVDPSQVSAWAVLANEPEILDFLSGLYGRYPFSSAGAIVDQSDVGYALESQTKPNYDVAPDLATVVHELAHQWWGNSVALTVWPDIWLNEGFATWTEWIYDERHGGDSAADRFNDAYAAHPADDPFWSEPPAALSGPEVMFTDVPYDRGAMTLQALRGKIGTGTFLAILRAWYAENRDGNVTTADFIALAERKSHRQLDRFFDVWLYRPVRPVTW